VTEARKTLWYTADAPFFRLSGFCFRKKGEPFRRFEAGVPLPPPVDSLSNHTPGGQLAFMTDSSFIRIRFAPQLESHLGVNTRIGAAGFDLYMGKPGGKQYFCGVTRLKLGENAFDLMLTDGVEQGMMEYTINFPLYSGVEYLEIGFDEKASFRLPTPWTDERPIVIYGTSIIHGGCANRPGMLLTNILSRRLNRPFLNFGFSGKGRGEAEVFTQLARISEPLMYLLDYGPNVNAAAMEKTLPEGIDILRRNHPQVPILVVSKHHYNTEIVQTGSLKGRLEDVLLMTAFQKKEVARRRRQGDKNIHFASGDWSYMKDWTEFTVDGVHPTDLGFYMQARMIEKHIRKYLK
jgi:hypothetical protein